MEKYITKIISNRFKKGYYYKIEIPFKNYIIINRRKHLADAIKIRNAIVKGYKKN